ncbi:nascent polypeptide-associated complex protein [Candidatus Bathyarchaeota archaeon]|nr:nascent polypeptide-associated complex protein [Candidatus Bathyarchaeota archaeon]RLI46072.1 MAG: nascent polypeptide-associated complex protein [Candidatus Bathyarchaeota archaeon]
MAHKAFRSMKGMPSGRDALRMMQKMGMDTKSLDDVRDVTIRTSDRKIIIEEPSVMSIAMQGQNMFQVTGGTIREETITSETKVTIPEEDVKMVAEQANVSMDDAQKALEGSGGDLAEAIVSLKKKV